VAHQGEPENWAPEKRARIPRSRFGGNRGLNEIPARGAFRGVNKFGPPAWWKKNGAPAGDPLSFIEGQLYLLTEGAALTGGII